MSDKMSNRKKSRENAFLAQFELSFCHTNLEELQENLKDSEAYRLDAFSLALLQQYQEHAARVEEVLETHLHTWSAERLSHTAQSLLRLSIAEMLYGEDKMDAVIINEAVELAKKYAGEKDYRFVNGVLGAVSRELHPEQNAAQDAAAPEAVIAPEKAAEAVANIAEKAPAQAAE